MFEGDFDSDFDLDKTDFIRSKIILKRILNKCILVTNDCVCMTTFTAEALNTSHELSILLIKRFSHILT